MRTLLRLAPLAIVVFAALGCSTSQDVVVNPSSVGHSFHSAYLVAHGDKSSDVDAAIQRELFRRGITVAAGPEGKQPETSEAIVKYNDDWGWDMAMYLKTLDLQIYDAKSGSLLASAGWKNSAMHGFHGLTTVVSDLITGVLNKLGMR
ncbi:MAG TPA: hypothetical protein VGQ65_25810 [Thermoanaerobaculia bacterium]|jgi:hypothetical protein|nr:hypothetical protein [Thermoanaerobaculia bacterium]